MWGLDAFRYRRETPLSAKRLPMKPMGKENASSSDTTFTTSFPPGLLLRTCFPIIGTATGPQTYKAHLLLWVGSQMASPCLRVLGWDGSSHPVSLARQDCSLPAWDVTSSSPKRSDPTWLTALPLEPSHHPACLTQRAVPCDHHRGLFTFGLNVAGQCVN